MGSTWPEDAPELKPPLDLMRKPAGQSVHPPFATSPVTLVHGEQRVSKTYVRAHARGQTQIDQHYRGKPQQAMAEPTNAETVEIYGGKQS